MIGRITGVILEKSPPGLVVDVQGVGYELQASMSTFSRLPAEGEKVVLHTHLCIREDAHLLYGFAGKSERTLFRELIKINGVGPRLALSILSVMDEQALVMCVHDQDAAVLTRVPGVGKKTAGRLLVEMQGRLDGLECQSLDSTTHSLEGMGSPSGHTNRNAIADAINALVSLGYRQRDAAKAVNSISDRNTLDREQMIRQALKSMS